MCKKNYTFKKNPIENISSLIYLHLLYLLLNSNKPNPFQILSICTFVISIFYEKFLGGSQQIQAKKGKRKDGKQTQNGVLGKDELSDAEKANILSQVLKELKTTLTDCDKALGKSKTLIKFSFSLKKTSF